MEKKKISKLIRRGYKPDGSPCIYHMDGYLQRNLNSVIDLVKNKGWDYVAIVTGIPGSGKSNFTINCARYCDENFSLKNIAFTDKDFVKITNKVKEFSAVVLDESFVSLNTKVTNSRAFIKIINHLQLVRQKHLFIFLVLPNFFDLSKGVAIFRSSHLFVTYASDEGERGKFLAFDRMAKKDLYILGSKFLNYNAVQGNFFGSFVKQKAIDESKYDLLKKKHLVAQTEEPSNVEKSRISRDKLILYVSNKYKITQQSLADVCGISIKTIGRIISKNKDGQEI